MLIDHSWFDPDRISDETRLMRARLQEQSREWPKPWDLESVVDYRRTVRDVLDGFGASSVEWAEDRSIEGRGGHEIALRVFVGETVEGVYLHFHGGGLVLGPSPSEDRFASFVEATGVAVVSVDYRLAPEHPWPAPYDDAEDAAVWLAEHAGSEFGTETLFIGGSSAGAGLAASTLLRLRDANGHTGWRGAVFNQGGFDRRPTRSKAEFDDDPVFDPDLEAWFEAQWLPAGTDVSIPELSPVLADLSGMPPGLFVIGTLDPLLDGTLHMAARWEAGGNQADLAVYPGGFHSFDAFPIDIARQARERLHAWVGEHAA